MPFTVSHAAIAAPLARRGLILSAVVAGSMAPDFQYFLTLSVDDRGWHVFPGLFLYALPAALIALWVFHRVLKRPLVRILPENHRIRLAKVDADFPFLPLRRFALIVASTLVGLLTHVGLDAFTHRDGIVVELLPVFRTHVLANSLVTLALCDLLQDIGTVLLSVVLVAQYWRWFRAQPVAGRAGLAQFFDVRREWPFLVAFSAAAGVAALILAHSCGPNPRNPQAFRSLGEYVLVAAMALLAVELTVFSLILDRFVFRPARDKKP